MWSGPWPYLDAWLEGQALSPAEEVADWAAENPDVCPQPPEPTVRIDRACPADRVPGAGFVDVTRETTRGQMATIIVQAYEHAADTSLPTQDVSFLDVDGLTRETSVRKAAVAGFVSGRSRYLYLPHDTVQRAPMASFLARTLDRFVADGLATLP